MMQYIYSENKNLGSLAYRLDVQGTAGIIHHDIYRTYISSQNLMEYTITLHDIIFYMLYIKVFHCIMSIFMSLTDNK